MGKSVDVKSETDVIIESRMIMSAREDCSRRPQAGARTRNSRARETGPRGNGTDSLPRLSGHGPSLAPTRHEQGQDATEASNGPRTVQRIEKRTSRTGPHRCARKPGGGSKVDISPAHRIGVCIEGPQTRT